VGCHTSSYLQGCLIVPRLLHLLCLHLIITHLVTPRHTPSHLQGCLIVSRLLHQLKGLAPLAVDADRNDQDLAGALDDLSA
jgi:hypothetical protein